MVGGGVKIARSNVNGPRHVVVVILRREKAVPNAGGGVDKDPKDEQEAADVCPHAEGAPVVV